MSEKYSAEFLGDDGHDVRVEADTREDLIIALKNVSLRPMTIRHGSVEVTEEEKFSIWAAARELRLGAKASM